jgi:hypothetical protein
MARGFESKSVADQQAEAESRRARRRDDDSTPDPAVALERRGLQLARADAQHRLDQATDERYRTMLQTAIADLDARLAKLA